MFRKKTGTSLVRVFCLGGGLKHILFSTLLAEMIQFDERIFSNGWLNHLLAVCVCLVFSLF